MGEVLVTWILGYIYESELTAVSFRGSFVLDSFLTLLSKDKK